MRHLCHARGCPVTIPARMLMCPRHWAMVPSLLQSAVWRRYRLGQEIDKRPSPEYLMALEQAIQAVADQEETP